MGLEKDHRASLKIQQRAVRNTSQSPIVGDKMVYLLPFSNTQVPSPGFGAMGMSFGLGSNLTLEQAEPVLLKATELGCTLWDTAVSSDHTCREISATRF